MKKILFGSLIFIIIALFSSGVVFLILNYVPVDTSQSPQGGGVFHTMSSINGVIQTRNGSSGDSTIQSILSSNCNPDETYDYCFENSETQKYGDARAEAYTKVQVSELDSIHNEGKYYVGKVKLHYNLVGDKFYSAENINNWDKLWDNCYKSGCRTTTELSSGTGTKVVASQPGDHYTSCPVFYAWDYDYDETSNGDWAWTWTTSGAGWIGENNCFDVKVVECIDNSDCTNERVCDNSGDWTTWSCVERPKMAYFTFSEESNSCSSTIKFVDEKTSLDYETFEECESNIKSDNSIIIMSLIGGILIILLVFGIGYIMNKK